MRALCNCDIESPTERPTISQSRCVGTPGYRARQILRGKPAGNCPMQRSRLLYQPIPLVINLARQYRCSASWLHRPDRQSLRSRPSGGDFLRRRISTRLTASLCSKWRRLIRRERYGSCGVIARNNTSWTRSSGFRWGLLACARQSAYTRRSAVDRICFQTPPELTL